MKNKQLSALEIIEETVKYYSKSPEKRRAMDHGDCVYLAENGNKCAVGRCMNKHAEFNYQGSVDSYVNDQCKYDQNFKLDNHLFPRYRGKSNDFWYSLQQLHDTEDNWDEKGLTQQGKSEVNYIKKKYASV